MSANLANSQTVDVATLEVCAALETEALKLACFEAIISKGRTAATEVPAAEAVSSAPVVTTEITNVSAVPARIEATSKSAGAMTVPPVSTVSSAGDSAIADVVEATPGDAKISMATDVATTERTVTNNLGREQLATRDEEEQNRPIKATVVEVTQGYNRDLRFHLANGQVWRQIEARHLQYPKNRDFEIEITKGMLGAYRMRIGENGRLVKIRRTQ